jgi:hypothetical protein
MNYCPKVNDNKKRGRKLRSGEDMVENMREVISPLPRAMFQAGYLERTEKKRQPVGDLVTEGNVIS